MARYLGHKPAVVGHYIVDEFISSGGLTYDLSRAPGDKNNIQVSAGGLVQYPSAYSVSGITLSLSGVPSGQKVVVRHYGDTTLYPFLDDGAVTEPKIADDAVTEPKILDGAVTQAKIHSAVVLGGPSIGTIPNMIRTNAKAITEVITFVGTENGITAGPVTFSGNGSVVVTTGSTWHIVT